MRGLALGESWVMWVAGAFAVASIGSSCVHGDDALERQLAELKQRFAELERQQATTGALPHGTPPPKDIAAAPVKASGPPPMAMARPVMEPPMAQAANPPVAVAPGVPAGPPPPGRAPDLSSPPRKLPVVKLRPIKVDPFAEQGEPTIRIGKKGRKAPPASRRKQGESVEYDRVDSYGNLVDREGRILYRAGRDSPPIDTVVDGEQGPEDEWEDDPHESPAAKAARAMRVPEVDRRADPSKKYSYQAARAGMSEAPGVQPGVEAVRVAPRQRQIVIEDRGLPEDRDVGIRVETRRPRADAPIHFPGAAQPAAPAPQPPVQVPAAEPPIAVPAPAAPAHVAPSPKVVVKRAPLPAPPTYAAAKSAPGPKRVKKQRSYKGKKERRVQALYNEAMGIFRAQRFKEAEAKFATLLKRYGDHELADNALYWMAETAYAEGNWTQALAWFQDLMLRYPTGNKAGDAMLKVALCYARLGDTSYALRLLQEVEALYATSPLADVAKARRQTLEQAMASPSGPKGQGASADPVGGQ